MKIIKMELTNFRNYAQNTLSLSGSVNIFIGDNGQGKTNILEAIHTIATTKSFRTSKNENLIKINEIGLKIECEISKNNVFKKVKFNLQPKNKLFFLNDKKINKISEIIGVLNVTVFCPEDILIIKGDAAHRRRFIDVALCQVDKIYLANLIEYQRILKNKSALLKTIRFNSARYEEVNLWNEQLMERAKIIYEKRRAFIECVNEENKRLAEYLSGDKDHVELVYVDNVMKGNPRGVEAYHREIQDSLIRHREEEIKRGLNLVGPHKDELLVMMNGQNIKNIGSQGQQRTVAISLRLAEVEYMHKITGEYPILLIDDIFSELDDKRKAHFMELLNRDTQMFLTGTRIEEFPNLADRASVFKIVEGCVEIYGQ